MSWFGRLKSGLRKSADALGGLFGRRKLDAATLQELEESLIMADLGAAAAAKIVAALAAKKRDVEISPDELRSELAAAVAALLAPCEKALAPDPAKRPHVVLIVGVNGTGKTTTVGKIAARFATEGRKVLVAAADTFRAAAVEQLRIWAARAGAGVIGGTEGADPAGVAYDALAKARAEGADLLLIDTAGRLHNKANLMDELGKIVRVLRKLDPTAPHDVMLVLDATTGQNALRQAEAFREVAAVSGLAMTKLDGTAKGGVLVALAEAQKLPVHYVGVGEAIDDLQVFDAKAFARALCGVAS